MKKVITNLDFEVDGMNRRDFLIYSSVVPLLLFPTPSEAFIPLLFRLFARQIVKPRMKSRTKRVNKPLIKEGNKNVKVKKGREYDLGDLADTTEIIENILNIKELSSDQVWDQHGNNPSSIVIANDKEYTQNTKDIIVNLHDTSNQNIDVHARIEPIDIPPKSNLILDMNFKKLPYEGIKVLNGTYGNNDSAQSSGRILVSSNRQGKSIEELYRLYEGNFRRKLIL